MSLQVTTALNLTSASESAGGTEYRLQGRSALTEIPGLGGALTSATPSRVIENGAAIETHLRTGSARMQLLVVDDDLPVLKACCEVAEQIDFTVHRASTAEGARELARSHSIDVVLMDLKMPGGGLTLLEEIRTTLPRSAIVVMTAFATITSAREAMRVGTTDYLIKPFAMDELTNVLARASERRVSELDTRRAQMRLGQQQASDRMIGSSPEMEKLYRIMNKVASSTHPILILGESGTGKETVARTTHNVGPNAARRFSVVECGQLAPAVLESELFGYTRNPVTGSSRPKTGILTSPEGGTLFLDGVSDLPLDLQSRLLRALQEKAVRPNGSSQTLPVTVRIFAASSRNLSAMVDGGLFRKDLFYRLNVVSLRIPPLRDRGEDIALLAEFFLDRMRRESGAHFTFGLDVMQTIRNYAWPGNVRELENVIERACSLASGPTLHMIDMPSQMQGVFQSESVQPLVRVDERTVQEEAGGDPLGRPGNLIVSIAELEREAILNTIRQLHGDKLMAAKLLGIGKTTLYRKLKEYGISDT